MKDYHISSILTESYKIIPNCLIIISISWYCSVTSVININKLNEKYKNIVILTNTEEETLFFKETTTSDVIFCNSNAFIDENYYFYNENIEKKYNLVINSTFKKYKNVELAKNIENVVHIGYKNDHSNILDEYIPDFGIIANKFIDNKYIQLSPNEISTIINSSYIGGIFSIEEGACYASTEYLLCGLPVLSTVSKGGRDIWYNQDNSIICEPDNIYESYLIIKNNMDKGIYNPIKIRANCLKIMEEHRLKLAEYIYDTLIHKFNIEIIEDKNTIKKMFEYYNWNDC
jgi:glycosyltransferase involved in cell wall biosynthesis